MQINLMFHEVGLKKYSGFYRDDSYKYVISSVEFEELINLSLKEENINGTRYEYTFDDGGISNMLSSEILLKNKLKGVFFIPTKFIGCKGFLTKNDIKELHNNGHVVGTHTHNHPRFLNKFNYDDQFFEWSRSSNILSDIIGNKVTVAGAPGGRYNIQTFDISVVIT